MGNIKVSRSKSLAHAGTQWGVEKLFQNSDEVIIRELKLYVEDREKLNIKNKSQLSRTLFMEKYGSLDLYDEDLVKMFLVDHEQLQFDKNSGWTLIGIHKKPDGFLSDHEYFCIHDDLFVSTFFSADLILYPFLQRNKWVNDIYYQ